MKKIYTTTAKNTLDGTKDIINDVLTEFLRESAQKMLKVAIEAEVTAFISNHTLKMADGQQRLVRNGYLPKRGIQTGIGEINVTVPRVRDRVKTEEDKLIFSSNLVPKYMRRTVTLDVLLPLLYLKGISEKDFQDALEPLLGSNAKAISPSVISKLKSSWLEEYHHWEKKDLTNKKYVYFWADGIYLSARMESEKSCLLVIIGADGYGNKELVGLTDGFRESKESWKSLLRDLHDRGLTTAPKLATGDGALGFWGALDAIYPTTKHQRCWVHKTVNVLDKLPKSQQAKAKSMLHDIYMAETKKAAEEAFDQFIETYNIKYHKAAECLAKDRDVLLAFYDFPAEHWVHLRTTNPIESTFATVRHRTKKSKGCFSRNTILACVFKLCVEAEKRWKKLCGANRLQEIINDVKFIDGVADYEAKNSPQQKIVEAA